MGKLKTLIIIIGTFFIVSAGAVATYFGFMAAGVIQNSRKDLTMKIENVEHVYDGEEHSASKALIVEGELVEGDSYVFTATSSSSKVGTAKATGNIVFYNKDGKEINSRYNLKLIDGEINILKRKLNITLKSASKVYDGTPLSETDFEADNLVLGDRIIPTFTTSVTYVTDEAKARIDAKIVNSLGTEVTTNYDIKYTNDDADLEITRRPVIIKTASASKVFDGEYLTNSDVEITGLVNGDYIPLETIETTKLKFAGEAFNDVTNANLLQILDEDGYDMTLNYQMFIQKTGKLVVTKRDLIINTPEYETIYNGEEQRYVYDDEDFDSLFDDADLELINKSGLYENIKAEISTRTECSKQTNVGTYKNDITFDLGTSGKNNFNIKYSKGSFVINKLEIKLNKKLAELEKNYDGKELLATEIYDISSASANFLEENEIGFTYINANPILNAGKYVTSILYTFTNISDGFISNVEVAYEPLEINIKPVMLDITMDLVKRTYDGNARTEFVLDENDYSFKQSSGEMVGLDKLTFIFKSKNDAEVKNAGNYPLEYKDMLINGAKSGNYKLKTDINSTTLEVEKAKIKLKLDENKIYDNIAMTFDKNHYLVTDGAISSSDVVEVNYKTKNPSGKSVKEIGSYVLNNFESSNDNYDITVANADANKELTFNVISPNVKVEVSNKPSGGLEENYTGKNVLDGKKLKCKITDEKGNDITSQLTNIEITYEARNENGVVSRTIYDAGKYTISVAEAIYGGAPLTIVENKGFEYTLAPKNVEVQITNPADNKAGAITYDGNKHSIEDIELDLVQGEIINILGKDELTYGDIKDSDAYYSNASIRFSIVDSFGNNKAKNYKVKNIEPVLGVYTVTDKLYFKPRTLSGTINNLSKVYDGTTTNNIRFDYDDLTVSGLVGNDTLSLIYTCDENIHDAKEYELNLSDKLINNSASTKYVVSNDLNEATYNVTKASLNVELDTYKIFDGNIFQQFTSDNYKVNAGTKYDEIYFTFASDAPVEAIGTYTLSSVANDNQNYDITINNLVSDELTFKVKAPEVKISLTHNGPAYTYNGSDLFDPSDFEVSVTDANNHSIGINTAELVLVYDIVDEQSNISRSMIKAGDHSISVSKATYKGENLIISESNEEIVHVGKKTATVSVENAHGSIAKAITYDTLMHSLDGVNVTGLVGGNTVSIVSKDETDFPTDNKTFVNLGIRFKIVDQADNNCTDNYELSGATFDGNGIASVSGNLYFTAFEVDIMASTFIESKRLVSEQMPSWFYSDSHSNKMTGHGAPGSAYTISSGMPGGYSIEVYFKECDFVDSDHDGFTDPGEYELEIDMANTRILYYGEEPVVEKVTVGYPSSGKVIVTA